MEFLMFMCIVLPLFDLCISEGEYQDREFLGRLGVSSWDEFYEEYKHVK